MLFNMFCVAGNNFKPSADLKRNISHKSFHFRRISIPLSSIFCQFFIIWNEFLVKFKLLLASFSFCFLYDDYDDDDDDACYCSACSPYFHSHCTNMKWLVEKLWVRFRSSICEYDKNIIFCCEQLTMAFRKVVNGV